MVLHGAFELPRYIPWTISFFVLWIRGANDTPAECPSDLGLILVEIMGIDGFFPGRWSHSGTPKRTSRRSFASIVAARLEVQRSHDS